MCGINRIVQFLLLHGWCLLLITAMPLHFDENICSNTSDCNDNTTQIGCQIHYKLKELASEARHLFDLYVEGQGFNRLKVDQICDIVNVHFPKFDVNNTSEKEKMVELFQIFSYLNASVGNITKDQKELNPKKEKMLRELNKTLYGIKGILSNLSCFLCKRYHVTHVNVHYGTPSAHNKLDQKLKGCKVLKKYKHFIMEAAKTELPCQHGRAD
ncbi:hypothetical protein GDO86_001723 [Hymenochirus boettgeri]|uniref:Leukemia inhibitory factor n=1 Tax=Hymenochirus boettgeri TaxID=247094 RepID=A0A8T2KI75_9PIPI|nr:hypothetical protein GDO86_001723 [Hymenochirus boettgeri]